ncbi:MAG TPA: flagellar assembly protein FliH [Chromatiales bacterium]|nr:flagellar assembly protein FliH [Chromatiales bacterium]
MTSSKYEDPAAAGEVRLWSAPPVGETAVDPATGGEEVLPLPTPEEIERIQRQAYEEAYAQGLEAGRQAGEEAVRARAAELAAVLRSLARPLEALDERVESELVHLVVAVARQLIRREIRTDPGHIVAAVREAVGVLPSSDATVHLHLHPEDAHLVREALTGEQDEGLWRIVEDPALTRGGCRVTTEVSQVDATLERRLAAVAAQVLGGERADDAGA